MKTTIKPSIERLINQAVAIETESAQDAGALGFMARAMIQATLPHKKVEGTYFERKNGNFTLSMLASPKIGLPYGSVPRLLLAWVTTEAVRTKSRELELGDSMAAFMADLGLTASDQVLGRLQGMQWHRTGHFLRKLSTKSCGLPKLSTHKRWRPYIDPVFPVFKYPCSSSTSNCA